MPTRKRRRATSEQAPPSMTEWTEALPDTMLLCRDIGHTWRPARAWIQDVTSG
jgi:hypothetical protein